MQGKKIRVQSLDPEHPSFASGTISTVFGEHVAAAVRTALGPPPGTPGILYARAWCCADRRLYHFVCGWPEPLAQPIHLRTG